MDYPILLYCVPYYNEVQEKRLWEVIQSNPECRITEKEKLIIWPDENKIQS